MKNMHTKSQRFIAVKLDTTGSPERKLLARRAGETVDEHQLIPACVLSSTHLLVVVQKLSIVVTPIITRAGTALTSNQKEINELVTRTIPGTKTVLR